jgi:hypothetical protein
VNPTTLTGRLPTGDTYIDANNPTGNYGSGNIMIVRPQPGGDRRSLVRFNLSDIPANSSITSARLYLYEMSSKTNLVVDVYRVTGDWAENTVTWGFPWANAGGDFDSSVAHAHFIPGVQNCSVSLDISSLVQGWVDESYPNYGVLLYAIGPSPFIEYATKEETTHPEWAPRLEITYSVNGQSQSPEQNFLVGWLKFLIGFLSN